MVPTWAADGNLYSGFADGFVGDLRVNWRLGLTGYAKIEGDNPLKLRVTDYGTVPNPPAPIPDAIRAAR